MKYKYFSSIDFKNNIGILYFVCPVVLIFQYNFIDSKKKPPKKVFEKYLELILKYSYLYMNYFEQIREVHDTKYKLG